jgi:hypothetical protein
MPWTNTKDVVQSKSHCLHAFQLTNAFKLRLKVDPVKGPAFREKERLRAKKYVFFSNTSRVIFELSPPDTDRQ